jgi:hypothetical protein
MCWKVAPAIKICMYGAIMDPSLAYTLGTSGPGTEAINHLARSNSTAGAILEYTTEGPYVTMVRGKTWRTLMSFGVLDNRYR